MLKENLITHEVQAHALGKLKKSLNNVMFMVNYLIIKHTSLKYYVIFSYVETK